MGVEACCLGCGKKLRGVIGWDGLLWTRGMKRRLAKKAERNGRCGYICKECVIGEALEESGLIKKEGTNAKGT